MASQAERDPDQKLRDELLIERYGLTPLVRPVGPHFPPLPIRPIRTPDASRPRLRHSVLFQPPIDIHAWLEAMQAAPQSQCVSLNPGATFNATANITIDPTP